MSREIKFRAWDKESKRMIVHEQDFVPLKVTNIGVFRLDACIKENRWILADSERFDIMQYTGLKDKDGTEIYEGDILERIIMNSGEPIIKSRTIVIFEEGMFKNYWVSEWSISKNWYKGDGLKSELRMYISEFAIIGNIYENKDLLD